MGRNITAIIDDTVDAILADPTAARQFIRERVRDGLALAVKEEWDMEDNFATTEQLVEDVRPFAALSVSDVETVAIVNDIEFGNVDSIMIERAGGDYDAWIESREEED